MVADVFVTKVPTLAIIVEAFRAIVPMIKMLIGEHLRLGHLMARLFYPMISQSHLGLNQKKLVITRIPWPKLS